MVGKPKTFSLQLRLPINSTTATRPSFNPSVTGLNGSLPLLNYLMSAIKVTLLMSHYSHGTQLPRTQRHYGMVSILIHQLLVIWLNVSQEIFLEALQDNISSSNLTKLMKRKRNKNENCIIILSKDNYIMNDDKDVKIQMLSYNN